MRKAQVCGHRLTSCGSGISIRPASESAGPVCASAKARPHLTMLTTAPAAARQRPKKAAKLLGRIFGGAERQYGNSELLRPGEYALQPLLRCLRDALPDALATYFDMNLQFAVGHGHAGRGRQIA